MGSVKDLQIIKQPDKETLGSGMFAFSDRYSVFDWGGMPEGIPHKGAALCLIAAHQFEALEAAGVPTHYRGVVDSKGQRRKIIDVTEPTTALAIGVAHVEHPDFREGEYDYSYFAGIRGQTDTNFVVPLECIYRNGAPEGSSLLKKMERLSEAGDAEELGPLLDKYGLDLVPSPGDIFPTPGYDFTTKFESTDRPLTNQEAQEISGLTPHQFQIELPHLMDKAVVVLGESVQRIGGTDYDGKLEFGLAGGQLMIVDVAGTPDENRWIFNGVQASKQVLRDAYIKTQPEWVEAVATAKEEAKQRGMYDWQSLTKVQPAPFDPAIIRVVSDMYAALANAITGRGFFHVDELPTVMSRLEETVTRFSE